MSDLESGGEQLPLPPGLWGLTGGEDGHVNQAGGRVCGRLLQRLPAIMRNNISFVLKNSVVDPDPHYFENTDPHPIKIRIRIRINLQMTNQNV
jgi:hypothetical protein